MTKRLKRPRDPAQLARLILDLATGEVEDRQVIEKDEKKSAAGKRGGLIGGKARAEKLKPSERSRIAKTAAMKRWNTTTDCSCRRD